MVPRLPLRRWATIPIRNRVVVYCLKVETYMCMEVGLFRSVVTICLEDLVVVSSPQIYQQQMLS